MHLVWTVDALQDVQKALEWYAARSPQAAKGLVLAIERLQEVLKLFPDAYPMKRPPLRRAVLGGYPYVLIYSVEKEALVVHGVVHTKRSGE